MEFQSGMIVRSKAGHDKGCFFVILSVSGNTALIADGASRSCEKPKRKNVKHLAFTNTVLDERLMNDDHRIRQELDRFNKRVRA